MSHNRPDDETLIRQIAAAETAALAELYDRYGRLVYSLAMAITGETSVAEEITQDVFLQVWNKAHTYDAGQGKVATWLTSVARYRSIDMLRRSSVRPEGHRVAWEDGTVTGPKVTAGIEPLVEMELERSRVRQALAQLPPEQREALAYAYFQGYSHQEIAEALGEPLGTVKTRIRLAMQKLRAILEEPGQ